MTENTTTGETDLPANADSLPVVTAEHQASQVSPHDPSPSARKKVAISILLVALVFLVFGQTIRFGFVNYDDDTNVYATPQIVAGISFRGIQWAFTHLQVGRWSPVAAISRMIDCRLFGLWAGGHHLSNILLHALVVLLLFLFLEESTGRVWLAGFVAAVFAVHPVHVEAVAWISARGELLSGFFFMLAVWSYSRYARSPGRRLYYALGLCSFVLGLLSKPMVVTLPFVLLILDYWPLNRFRRDRFLLLVIEKMPFFFFSVIFSDVTSLLTLSPLPADRLPLWLRLETAVLNIPIYLRQTFLPVDLAVFYPNPRHGLPLWQVAASAILVCVLTAAAWAFRKSCPALLAGWLWFVGMLVPVIGIVQFSTFAHADRYNYLPQIGLCAGVTWAVADWSLHCHRRRVLLGSMTAVYFGLLLFAACRQTACWRDSASLWTHALRCTDDNSVACNNLGYILFQQGRIADATAEYREAVRINPAYAEAHNNLGFALLVQGHTDAAIVEFNEALRSDPSDTQAHDNLGSALHRLGRISDAIEQYFEALQFDSADMTARYNLGNCFLQLGNSGGAIAEYSKVLESDPSNADAHANLGIALVQQGRFEEAVTQYRKSLQLHPANAAVHSNLGSALLLEGRAPEAVDEIRNALALQPPGIPVDPRVLRMLAAAYSGSGDFSDAVQFAMAALHMVQPNDPLVGLLRHDIKLYQSRHPFAGSP